MAHSIAARVAHFIALPLAHPSRYRHYQGIPESLDDDSVIEAALVHLDLEDLPLLLEIWDKAHIKRVWKDRLVSQGKRMNIRNYTLAVNFFEIQDPEEYLKRNAKFHKW